MRGKRGIRRFGGTRRFRKRRGVWLPTLGTNWGSGEDAFYDAAITFQSPDVADNRLAGSSNQEVFALIPDFSFLPSEGTQNRAASLHDRVAGNEWKLDRIVGGCHIQCRQTGTNEGQWPFVQVSAGIFVARSEEGQDGTPDLFSDEYDPINRNNIQNPWVWRKTWILANPIGPGVRDDFPISNFSYGATDMTDCSVNVKAKRRIRREHRLWFTYSVLGWDGAQEEVVDEGQQPRIQGLLDVRVFGTLINNPRGSSSF